MNKWRLAFFVCLAALVISNLFWLYTIFDSSVTQTYQQVTIDEQDQIINSLGILIVKGSKVQSQKDILFLLRKAKPEAFIVEETDKIIFEGIEFHFQNDKLVRVSK